VTRPLEGIRVLDLSRLLPGPFATVILSDLGASVIKIEDTGAGDYLRAFPPQVQGLGGRFAAVNRDKRSLALDLKQPRGVELLLRLVERADVLVESFRPGVLDKLGLGFAELTARNPRLILCSISGYGQSGPYRQRAGHDLDYIALAGVLGMTGQADGAPQMPGVQIADFAGGLWAATGICAALAGRASSGRGCHLDISMTEGALAFLLAEIGNLFAGATPRRGTEALSGGLACYAVYETRDGKHLAVGALEPKFWLALGEAIGRPAELAELAAPPAEQARVRAELAAIFRTRTRAEWEATLADKDVLVEPILEPAEVAVHPLHCARNLFYEVAGFPQTRTPLGEPAARLPPPTQGQHTTEVLRELGLGDAEIDELRQGGVIRG
jgi:crotonobetainyl-CoA:carnitine CoA-transferase CaiB-like acyl-CoA transferase